jgi:DNA-binding NarL/FixJ family response regulator
MRKDRVLIAEPSQIVRTGLAKILGDSGAFEVLSGVTEANEVDRAIKSLEPDVLIINPSILPYSRKAGSEFISSHQGLATVALVCQYIDPSVIAPFQEIIDIRTEGSRIPEIVRRAISEAGQHSQSSAPVPADMTLSQRETEVLVLVAKGLMNKEIADKLNISIHTVITHRKNITRKTGIKTVAGLTMYALVNNLIEENDVL